MVTVTTILVIIISLLIIERWMVRRSVRYLSLRVLVNGTRGKSSVTEYVAAGLSCSQADVMGKVTGIIPTIIYGGKKTVIERHGVARVQEQVNIIRLARKKKVKNLILECMSIAPELQKLEALVFQPHIYVITNIRDDHREEMGITLESQAEAICNAIPENCKVVTQETCFLDKIKKKAAEKKSTVVVTKELDHELKTRLPFGIFPENVALALTVCEEAGVKRSHCESGILNCILNSESPLITVTDTGKTFHLLNAFSVNDIDSTASFIKHWMNVIDFDGKITLILNTRADRPLRSQLFAEWIAQNHDSYQRIILTGNHTFKARSVLIKSGVEKSKIESWKGEHLRNISTNLINTMANRSLVVGVGNIGGDGFNIMKQLK